MALGLAPGTSRMKARLVILCFPEKSCFIVDLDRIASPFLSVYVSLNALKRE